MGRRENSEWSCGFSAPPENPVTQSEISTHESSLSDAEKTALQKEYSDALEKQRAAEKDEMLKVAQQRAKEQFNIFG